MNDLEFHKVVLKKVINNFLDQYIQNIWDDAIKSVTIIDNEKKNTASNESLTLFANFIVQGVDLEGLVQSYEEEVFDRLYGLTDEELQKEKEFYDYLD